VLGIVLGQKDEKGFIVIDRIEPGSLAADAKLVKGDLIIEVNGRSTREFEVSTLSTYLANKAAEGSSILVLYERDGKQEMVTLKQAD
jgi:C-terminal processing protease CtpA/Prc